MNAYSLRKLPQGLDTLKFYIMHTTSQHYHEYLANNLQAAGYPLLDCGPTTMTRGSWQILVFVYIIITRARMPFEGWSDPVCVLRQDNGCHQIQGMTFKAAEACHCVARSRAAGNSPAFQSSPSVCIITHKRILSMATNSSFLGWSSWVNFVLHCNVRSSTGTCNSVYHLHGFVDYYSDMEMS